MRLLVLLHWTAMGISDTRSATQAEQRLACGLLSLLLSVYLVPWWLGW